MTAAVVGWLAAVGGGVAVLVVRLLSQAPILPNVFGMGDAAIIAFLIQSTSFASVGALLVHRRPANAVGRVLLVCGIAYAVGMLAATIGFAAAVGSPSGSATAVAAWLAVVLSFVGAASLPYLALIFPTGRAHSERWERVRRVTLAMTVVMAAAIATQPGPTQLFGSITNPFGVGPDFRLLLGERAVSIVTAFGGAGVAMIAAVAVVSRFRSASAVERQQLKWFISAAVASLAVFALTSSLALEPDGSPGGAAPVVLGLTGATIPVAIGIAILRYRLYDIDRLIGRTLAYGAVMAVLGGVYAAAVVTLGSLLASFAEGDSLAVAAATLIVFALFGPLRRRVQQLVERRFDRSSFDRARVVEAFAGGVRDEVDLDELIASLRTAVKLTLQPSSSTVWLRTAPDPRVGPGPMSSEGPRREAATGR